MLRGTINYEFLLIRKPLSLQDFIRQRRHAKFRITCVWELWCRGGVFNLLNAKFHIIHICISMQNANWILHIGNIYFAKLLQTSFYMCTHVQIQSFSRDGVQRDNFAYKKVYLRLLFCSVWIFKRGWGVGRGCDISLFRSAHWNKAYELNN